MKITIGDFLIKRLKELDIRHVIGVPGDFNLQFLEQIRATRGIEFVGASNELNAAYAADGYARQHGISALNITYGVGDLGAIGGVAGSAAEHVPVIVISGAPPLYATRHNFGVHHSLGDGDFSNIPACYQQFTAANVLITQENAKEEIDRAIRKALRHKLPVYIQLPSNISYLFIDVDDQPLTPVSHQSDAERLKTTIAAALDLFDKAKKPAVLIDMDVDRLDIKAEVLNFIEKTQTPFAAMSTGKAILSEQHSLYLGIYKGDESEPGVQEAIENADFLLTVSPRFIEWNSGSFSASLPTDKVVRLSRNQTFVGAESFEAVAVADVLSGLVKQVKAAEPQKPKKANELKTFKLIPDKPLTQAEFWKQVHPFIHEGDVVYAETGTASQALGGMRLPKDTTYVASLIWGAIGFTLPAIFGSLLASPEKRHLLFIGDGSFQVTGQALARILDRQMAPIIFLINNDGYTIERYIMGMKAPYNDIPAWQYHRLPELLTAENKMLCFNANTQGELQEALEKAVNAKHGALIEVHMHQEDAPEALKKFGPAVAEFNYGPRGPKNAKPAKP